MSAFGLNVVDIAAGDSIPEHDETGRDQEEVFLTLAGSPTLVVDGTDHPLPQGTFARLDVEPRRTVRNDGAGAGARPHHVRAANERLRADELGMSAADVNGAAALEAMIGRYNDAWNAHDVDAILALHAPGMVFENHTAGELAEGDAVGPHIAAIFEGWPDLRFETRRLYTRDGLVVQEWTAHATHTQAAHARRASSPSRRATRCPGWAWTSSPARAGS